MISDVTSPLAALTPGVPSQQATKDRNDEESRESNQGVSPTEESRDASGQTLSADERRQVNELRARDQEVRTHEQAHVAAAGALFRGGPYYTYQAGPDGKRYAVGGSVKIDTSEGATPEQTIQKAAQIRAAALAPAEPSSADQAIAAKASQMQASAQRELAQQEAEPESEPGTKAESDSEAGPTIGPATSAEIDPTSETPSEPEIEQPSEEAPSETSGGTEPTGVFIEQASANPLGRSIDTIA